LKFLSTFAANGYQIGDKPAKWQQVSASQSARRSPWSQKGGGVTHAASTTFSTSSLRTQCERRDPYRGVRLLGRMGNALRKTMACGYGPLLVAGATERVAHLILPVVPMCRIPTGIALTPKSERSSMPSRTHKRGVSRSSRTLGAGCDGRGVSADERQCRGRRSRMVLAPRRWR